MAGFCLFVPGYFPASGALFQVVTSVSEAWLALDRQVASVVAAVMVPLAIYILFSALDDLILDCFRLIRPRRPMPERSGTPSRIAVFIPMWNEAAVARPMLEHNLAALNYPDYEVFVGVYPNDAGTRAAVQEVASQNARVQICEVAHPGPTSKADCLNAVWACMQEHELSCGWRFDLVVLHDAEDLIHPESLEVFHQYSAEAGMVQLPVLPLETGLREWTHGVYCDDFAESQSGDLEVRVRLGAFLPGCGVGTAFQREVLESLALATGAGPFDKELLTEDYDTGLRLYQRRVSQVFVPLVVSGGKVRATREYFPRNASTAIRQRTRWVAGNSLQAWKRHGWSVSPRANWHERLAQRWFLWRDRKGLWGNPLSLLCNLSLAYGVVSAAAAVAFNRAWNLGDVLGGLPFLRGMLWLNFGLLCTRLAFRTQAARRIYGWRFALGVVPRMIWANVLNTAATLRAIRLWIDHTVTGRSLTWGKTSHSYPDQARLAAHKRPLVEILLQQQVLHRSELEAAVGRNAGGAIAAADLLRTGLLTEEQIYQALSTQLGLPLAAIRPSELRRRLARALPAHVQERWGVLPFDAGAGRLYIAVSQAPSEDLQRELRRWTRLEIRFRLLPPRQFDRLRRRLDERKRYNPENGASQSTLTGRRNAHTAGTD